MRSVLIVIFVFFYLLLGLPVLGAAAITRNFLNFSDIFSSLSYHIAYDMI